jgi:hypothetical protein
MYAYIRLSYESRPIFQGNGNKYTGSEKKCQEKSRKKGEKSEKK